MDFNQIFCLMNGFVYLPGVVTLELDAGKCNGCRMCMMVCPHAVFEMENKRAVIRRRDFCMECGACAKNCPEGAITVKSGVGCAAGIINGILRGTEPTCDCDTNGGCC
jgi:ferredoxin